MTNQQTKLRERLAEKFGDDAKNYKLLPNVHIFKDVTTGWIYLAHNPKQSNSVYLKNDPSKNTAGDGLLLIAH